MTREAVARVHVAARELAHAARIARGLMHADDREAAVVADLLAVLDAHYAPYVEPEVVASTPARARRLRALRTALELAVDEHGFGSDHDEAGTERYALLQKNHLDKSLMLTTHDTVADALASEVLDEYAADWYRVALYDLDASLDPIEVPVA